MLPAMEFEWDEKKSAGNKEKHGISFPEVLECLDRNGVIDFRPNPSHRGQQLLVFRRMSGAGYWVAVIEPRGEKWRLITVQRRRKMRKYYGP